MEVNCDFCGKGTRVGSAFWAAEDDGGRCSCICHDCVRDLYIAMIAEEMRPAPPTRNIAPRPAAAPARVIRLHPPRGDH